MITIKYKKKEKIPNFGNFIYTIKNFSPYI